MNKPLSKELQATIAKDDAPSFGPDNAKVTIVEFSDFQCPYCSRAADVASKVREKYGDRVRFVFRQYPLPFHPNARGAAEAALAAHAQGKFWEFHDRLFENQQALDREALEKHAKDSGLNVGKFRQALEDKAFAKTVDSDMKLGEKVTVQGTPTMFLNGARVADPTNFDAVSKMIDEALKS
jgi:protein-disulfide isomerase